MHTKLFKLKFFLLGYGPIMHTTTQLQIDDTLSAVVFLDMIKAGAHKIISSESLLNQLNVFPVSDRDTGSNMATLMRFILSQSYSTAELSLLLRQLADASLIGACGNSGMIFSAFFVGLASNNKVTDKNFFTIEMFIECLHFGVKQAYQAVANPTKGTILTVMSEWLKEFINAFKYSKDFTTIFQKSICVAEQALNNTEFQLPVLRRNHVVDAGAFGFVKFIQGMYEHLKNPHQQKHINLHTVEEVFPAVDRVHLHQIDERPQLQYCMEILLTNSVTDIDQIKYALTPICDSLVVNRSPSHIKVHAHTNNILQITHILKKHGTILHQKIDDMKKQWEITHARKHRIALVTDSSADLPEEWLSKEQIHVLHTQIRLGEHTFLDRLSIDYNNLNRYMHQDQLSASTATPTPELVARYLRYLSLNYDSVIVIAISSQLSSTYQMIANQAATIKTVPIDVIDSRKCSAAHGLLVMLTARWIAAGHSHQEIINKIETYRDKICLFMVVDDFKAKIKSGRIPKPIQLFFQWRFLKPVLALNQKGKASLANLAFGKKMSWRIMVKLIKKTIKRTGIQSIAIAHTATKEQAQDFTAYLEKHTGLRVDFVLEASCSMGLHIGPGCFAIATAAETIEPTH